MKIEEILENKQIPHYDVDLYREIKKRWDAVAKPLDSMGYFEHFISQIGAINETVKPRFDKCAIVVFAADNGIVEEGISQSEQALTAICTQNIANMNTSVCVMAKANQTEVLVVDVGVNAVLDVPNLRNEKVRMGTRNFHKEKALTKAEVLQAMQVGMNLAVEYKQKGYDLLGVGEIGIGNTTTSSAVTASLLGCPAQEVTGRGAGLSDERLARKIEAIDEAILRYDLYHADPLEVLCCVGGLDLAGMVGFYIGAAMCQIPIVLDGVISMATALVANRLVPGVCDIMVPSHTSKEPAAAAIVKELGLTPVLQAQMALGEGTGAAMMIGLLKTANEVYRSSGSFVDAGIEQYERFGETK